MFLIKGEFKKFLNSPWGLEIWWVNKRIFRSKKSGVKGLLDFVKGGGKKYKNLIVFDKIIGQGAALLAIYLKAQKIYGVIGSKSAAKTLRKYKTKFYFYKTVANILNQDKTDICPMEKFSLDKTPKKFYDCFIKKYGDSN